ncbi:monooxygenase 2-like [Cryptomeria japonica]|uniref:monooxygenase 2-like n=1 Tax=Cryptomeria japonica TaxID=3369 RepID=UPI0027DAADBC|nr:monooxygenase 2-like [Cryptomeria japonica]
MAEWDTKRERWGRPEEIVERLERAIGGALMWDALREIRYMAKEAEYYRQLYEDGLTTMMESRCIERIKLIETLAKELPKGTIRFSSKVVLINKKNPSSLTSLKLEDGQSITTKILIGCDGVYSLVGSFMGIPPGKSSGRIAIRGMVTYAESHQLEKFHSQVWDRGLRAGFIPCTDKQVYWFLTRRSKLQDANISGDAEKIRHATLDMVRHFPKPFAELIKASPTESISYVDMKVRLVWPWMKLLPGTCSSLEDAIVLGRCLGETMKSINTVQWGEEEEKKIEQCFNKYLQERRWRVFTLVNAALIIGIVNEGSSKLIHFARDKILFPLFSVSYLRHFADFDCGNLKAKYS